MIHIKVKSLQFWRIVICGFLVSFFVAQVNIMPARSQLINLPDTLLPRTSLDITQIGNLELGNIRLDGQILFQVAAPASSSSGDTKGLSPIERRVKIIEFHLTDFVRDGFDPETLEVAPGILNNQTVILASDQDRKPRHMMTVTNFDLEIDTQQSDLDTLAEHRAAQIRSAFLRARYQRQPEYLQQQIRPSLLTLIAMILSSLLIGRLQKWRSTRSQTLYQRKQTLDEFELDRSYERDSSLTTEAAIASEPARTDRRFRLANLLPHLTLDQQTRLNQIAYPLLVAAQVAIWLIGSALILQRFAQTRALSNWLTRVPIALIDIPIGVAIVYMIVNILIQWQIKQYYNRLGEKVGPNPRLQQRCQTISQIVQELTQYLFILIGLMLFFYVINALNIAVIVLAAIAFLAQNVLKDFLETYFILHEDQYAVRDVIQIGDVMGEVEKITLRATQVRKISRELVTIANSSFSEVMNHTRQESGLSLDIDVAYSTDLDRAIAVIEQVATELYTDSDWGQYITEKPDLKGVNAFGDNSITIRLVIVTQPGEHWMVGREFRRRLKPAFDRAGITIPFPQRSIWFENSLPPTIKK